MDSPIPLPLPLPLPLPPEPNASADFSTQRSIHHHAVRPERSPPSSSALLSSEPRATDARRYCPDANPFDHILSICPVPRDP